MVTVLRFSGGWIDRLGSLCRDTRGAVAVYVALSTLFVLPLMAVSIDLTRYYGLHTELEQAAQAAALAGAKELDFTDDGLAAATAAATSAVQNVQAQATDKDEPRVLIQTVQFLEALPPAGQTNYEAYITDEAEDVRYIRVITEPRAIDSPSFRAFLAMWSNVEDVDAAARKITIGAAVAGRTTVACRTMPLMTCNPVEGNTPITQDYPNPDPNQTGFDRLSDFLKAYPEWTRRQVRVKFLGPDTGYANGVFGLLEPNFSANNGAKGIEDELALGVPASCIQLDSVTVGSSNVKTGQAQTIVDGINVRFDIFRGNWKQDKNDPDYAPAADVIKGMLPKNSGQVCTPDFVEDENPDDLTGADLPDAKKLPQDECFTAETAGELATYNPKCYAFGAQDGEEITPNGNKGFAGRYGNGRYNLLRYFQVNHPTLVEDDGAGGFQVEQTVFDAIVARETAFLTANGMSAPTGSETATNPSVPPSRASVYEWEVTEDLIPGPGNTGSPPPEEEGTPQCSSSTPAGLERRSLYIAVVNCKEHADELNNGDRVVPVQEFAEVFLTEPADHNGQGGSGDKGAIYIEFRRAVQPGNVDNVVLRDLIQLY